MRQKRKVVRKCVERKCRVGKSIFFYFFLLKGNVLKSICHVRIYCVDRVCRVKIGFIGIYVVLG